MANQKEEIRRMVSDDASQLMLHKAREECVDTCFDRLEEQKNPCAFGESDVCCRICHTGPCRITPKTPYGICGADADIVVARNFLREVAGGVATHADSGRHLALELRQAAQGEANGYAIADEAALRRAARDYGVEEEGRTPQEVALDVADLFLQVFTSQEETIKTLASAPQKRQGVWKAQGVMPLGIDRMCVAAMHRTAMGAEYDYQNLLKHAFAAALSDGWGGSRVAAVSSDILFGTPTPVKSAVNLGVLKEDTVNIVLHGPEPALAAMIAEAAQDPEIIEYAQKAGANGITLAGLCCTADAILMRRGMKVAGNRLQQELALITGAVEMMVVGTPDCMPSLPQVAAQYHTEMVSVVAGGTVHIPFEEANPLESTKVTVRRAVDNFKNRDPKKVIIPKVQEPLVAGFSVHAIKHMLGGRYRASFRLLNDAILQNRIVGVVGIVGGGNPKQKADDYTVALIRALIERNVLVFTTGCAAIAAGKAGLLRPEAGLTMAGDGLREVCQAVGMPPVLHMGGCADNSRMLEAAAEMVREGGLGDDLSDLPLVGVLPEWMSENEMAIGCSFVASGVDVILGVPFSVDGSENVSRFLTEETGALFGGAFHTIQDPLEAAEKSMALLTAARDKLGINKKAERKLFDMKDRRDLYV